MPKHTNTLFVLTGPTGVGKTELSLVLAEFLCCDIVNADSRQIYAGIPISTAAPTKEQRARVPHHLVECLPLDAYYSAAQFEQDALRIVEEQFARSGAALVCGGAMLYIDALCKGIDNMPNIDEATRTLLAERYAYEGLAPLLDELGRLDPEHRAKVDPHNVRRVLHALEVCYVSGRPYSSFLGKVKGERPFRIVKIGLNRPREVLFARINERVTAMAASGLMDEAERVYPLRHLNSLNTVGMKEAFKVIEGEWSLDFALDRLRKNTRVYAKKQLTWLAKDTDVYWYSPDDPTAVLRFVASQLNIPDHTH